MQRGLLLLLAGLGFACATPAPRSPDDLSDVNVAYERVTQRSTFSFTTRFHGCGGSSDRSVSGVLSECWLMSWGDCWAVPGAGLAVDDYLAHADHAILRRVWPTLADSLCKLYEQANGQRDLVLGRFYSDVDSRSFLDSLRECLGSHPPPAQGASVHGVIAREKSGDWLCVGIRCPTHDGWALMFVLPPSLEGNADGILQKVVVSADDGAGRIGWCSPGRHEVMTPNEGIVLLR